MLQGKRPASLPVSLRRSSEHVLFPMCARDERQRGQLERRRLEQCLKVMAWLFHLYYARLVALYLRYHHGDGSVKPTRSLVESPDSVYHRMLPPRQVTHIFLYRVLWEARIRKH